MQTMINPQRFVGQEMSLAPLSRGQSAVLLAGLRIGRVSHAAGPDGKSRWMWCLTGPHCSSMVRELKVCGDASSLAEAKLQLRQTFDTWLNRALEQEGPSLWHWTEAAPERGTKDTEGVELALAG